MVDAPTIRADLGRISKRADSLRLKRLGSRPAHSGDVQVGVYELIGP